VVVDNLDIEGVTGIPTKADAPLLINPNAVLAGTVAGKCFKAIRWRDSKVSKVTRMVEHGELVEGTLLNVAGQLPRPLLVPYPLRLRIGKTLDHPTSLALFPPGVNN
jgi:hypothetical protein